MTQPVVYVSTWRIKEGKFDDYVRFHEELAAAVKENEPRTVAFLAFANEDGTEITGVHVFPDQAALDLHMAVLAEKMGVLADDLTAVYQYMEPVRIQRHGNPGEKAEAMDGPLEASGVPFTFRPRFIGGFVRSAS